MVWDTPNSLIFFLGCGIDCGREYEEGATTCASMGLTSRYQWDQGSERMKEAGANAFLCSTCMRSKQTRLSMSKNQSSQ